MLTKLKENEKYSCEAKLELGVHINVHTVHDAYKWDS